MKHDLVDDRAVAAGTIVDNILCMSFPIANPGGYPFPRVLRGESAARRHSRICGSGSRPWARCGTAGERLQPIESRVQTRYARVHVPR